jgi:hypothetical protein
LLHAGKWRDQEVDGMKLASGGETDALFSAWRTRKAKQQLADIYIAPPVYQFGLLEFGAYDPIMEIGYCTAKEALERERAI